MQRLLHNMSTNTRIVTFAVGMGVTMAEHYGLFFADDGFGNMVQIDITLCVGFLADSLLDE